MREILQQTDFAGIDAEYAAFEEKFKPKKTTDDCYTPEPVYEAVADYVAKKYGRDKAKFVRPFYPGGDYTRAEYPDGCTVVDNPPFSILAQIERFYQLHRVPFFLFAPALTTFQNIDGVNFIVADALIIYANGASVPTNFATNMGEWKVEIDPALNAALRKAVAESKTAAKELPKYFFPDAVISSALLGKIAKRDIPLRIRAADCAFIRRLDIMPKGDGIFGGAFLLSERAAAERAAAERAAAERAAARVFELSPREREIQRLLARREGANG